MKLGHLSELSDPDLDSGHANLLNDQKLGCPGPIELQVISPLVAEPILNIINLSPSSRQSLNDEDPHEGRRESSLQVRLQAHGPSTSLLMIIVRHSRGVLLGVLLD